MTDPARAAHAYVGAFVEELARAGVRHACISPGSRSTPLALTIADNARIRTWMHVDERSGAFFALGLARTLDEPVVLLCTSGTAAANFFPAVVEAQSAGVPLVVLTADRPPEMRDVGAAQTIDQNRLYGAHAKWFVEVAIPEDTPDLLRYARTLAARATATANASPRGPVHLNFPFREPLVPVAGDPASERSPADVLAQSGRPKGEPWVTVTNPPRSLDNVAASRIAARLNQSDRPMIVCGPQPDVSLARPLANLARTLDAPLLADPLSQLRWGSHQRAQVIERYDSVLRHEPTATALRPDLILRIGGAPTSKTLLQFFQKHEAVPQLVIDAASWPDPALVASEIVHADPGQACDAIAAQVEKLGTSHREGGWLERWRSADSIARETLERFGCALDEPFEGSALAEVVEGMPEGSTLFVSSSMPVRDLDTFGVGGDRAIRVLANRGANGIDGVVSTALGAAAACKEMRTGPLVLVIGDLALYHDMNGLLAAKVHSLDATVVVLNNDGGGIFSFLPQAASRDHFEKLFGTPHGLSFEPVASLYSAKYARVSDNASLRAAQAASIAEGGLHIIEMRTDRARNVELHHEAHAAVASALSEL